MPRIRREGESMEMRRTLTGWFYRQNHSYYIPSLIDIVWAKRCMLHCEWMEPIHWSYWICHVEKDLARKWCGRSSPIAWFCMLRMREARSKRMSKWWIVLVFFVQNGEGKESPTPAHTLTISECSYISEVSTRRNSTALGFLQSSLISVKLGYAFSPHTISSSSSSIASQRYQWRQARTTGRGRLVDDDSSGPKSHLLHLLPNCSLHTTFCGYHLWSFQLTRHGDRSAQDDIYITKAADKVFFRGHGELSSVSFYSVKYVLYEARSTFVAWSMAYQTSKLAQICNVYVCASSQIVY